MKNVPCPSFASFDCPYYEKGMCIMPEKENQHPRDECDDYYACVGDEEEEYPEIIVNHNSLISILENYVEGFNDCACCPCYFQCKKDNESFGSIDPYYCSRIIRDETLQARNI